jgi:glucose-6-phosphate 1-dehydrogenase
VNLVSISPPGTCGATLVGFAHAVSDLHTVRCTGDLARRMVLPAVAALAVHGLLPDHWVLIGNGRRDDDDAWFADHVLDDDAKSPRS